MSGAVSLASSVEEPDSSAVTTRVVAEIRAAALSLRRLHYPGATLAQVVVDRCARQINQRTTLDQLLDAYLILYTTAPVKQLTTEAQVTTAFAIANFSLDEFVNAIAELYEENPDTDPALAGTLIRPQGRWTEYKMYDRMGVVRFSEDVYRAVLGDFARSTFLLLHSKNFTPPLTRDEHELAKVLLNDWPGTIASLIDTVRVLRSADSGTVTT
jgi:hypothetical protein